MAFQQFAGYAAAILFAALPTATLAVGIGSPVNLVPLALGVAVAHAALIGLPLFLFLRRKGWANALSSACAGFVIGAVPQGAIAWPRPSPGSHASVNGIPTIVDGAMTLAGWLNYGKLLMLLGLIGALSGLVFWLTLRWAGQSTLATREVGGSQHRAEGPVPASRAVPLAAIALLLTGAVAAIPEIAKDRTCHNMFRDGRRTGIAPQAHIQLDVDLKEWPKLIQIFEKFGAAHNLLFRSSSQSKPGVVEMLYLSLCNEQGVNVRVSDQRWASRNYAPFGKGGTDLGVYELQANSGWERIAQGLVSELDSTWPGRVRFFPTQTDRSGGSK
jgi:hypothetical protein